MKLVVVAVGHRMPAWIASGFEEYARRMPREMRISLAEIRPEPRGGTTGVAGRARAVAAEAKRIAAQVPPGSVRVVLDEQGKAFPTRELAQRIGGWQQLGRDVAFVIGGADGTAAALRDDADLVWSLSPLTLPHGLVRVVLAEQLYRASSMLKNHPYHRD